MNKYLKICVYCIIAIFFSVALSGCDYNGRNSGSIDTNSETATTTPTASTQSQPITTPESTPTFQGNTCTGDCSGHEAGYNWAEEKGITDPDDCGGNSTSFIEGCESYAEENSDS